MLTAGTLGTMVLVTLAWRRPKERVGFAAAALCTAVGVCFRAIVAAYAATIATGVEKTGKYMSLPLKEELLAEAYADGARGLALASVVLVLTCGFCLFAFRTRRARLVPLAVAAALLAPMGWLATRGIGLHDRLFAEEFADVPTGTERERCDILSDLVVEKGDMGRAEKFRPNARRLAHHCVASWLSTLDRGGPELAELESRAAFRHHMGQLKGSTALDFVAASNLLVDAQQLRDVRSRQAMASTSR